MRSFLLAALTLALPAFADGEDGLRITNGIQNQPARFSAIILQDGCTGTFVSPTTILTAAHCADHGFTYKGVPARSFQSMPEALGIPWSFRNDVRVLIFPQPVAPAWIPVVNDPVFQGLHVVVAGFGTFDMTNGQYDARFRYGTNFVAGFGEDGQQIQIEGTKFASVGGAEGTDSGIGPGDSGGALLWNGRLAGVTSAVSDINNSRERGYFVNLTHPNVRAYLNAQIANNGADIRFSDQGSIPYQECFDLDPNQRVFTFLFDVPHSNISSMSGEGGAHLRVFRKPNANRGDNVFFEDNEMNAEFYTFAAPSFGAHILVKDGQPTPRYVCFI